MIEGAPGDLNGWGFAIRATDVNAFERSMQKHVMSTFV